MSVASVWQNGGKYLLVSILLIAGCAAKNQRVSEPTIIAVGMDYSVALQSLKARGMREVESLPGMTYPIDADGHLHELDATSLMIVLVHRESGAIRYLGVCHNADKPIESREWMKVHSYDLSGGAPRSRTEGAAPP